MRTLSTSSTSSTSAPKSLRSLLLTALVTVLFALPLANASNANSPFTIYTFHGSPGTPEDFSLVQPLVNANLGLGIEWIPFPKEETKFSYLNLKENYIFVAYSFGCYKAIMEAKDILEKNTPPRPKAIFCIAPYLEEKASGEQGLIDPIIDSIAGATPTKWALSLLGPLLIKRFITKTADPKLPPKAYLAQSEKLSDPELLSRSFLEKRNRPSLKGYPLALVINSKIPLYLINGNKDKMVPNSPTAVHNTIPWGKDHRFLLLDGGHALPWTHPEAVALKMAQWLHTNHL